MERIISFLLFVTVLSPRLGAQAAAQNKIACSAYQGQENHAYKKKLWDGYEISLGPARNSQGPDGDNCTAAIYNVAGRVVYRTTGFNVVFDEEVTGKDFDGDGHPEVVFKTDTGGGMHCCWEYNVISLAPKPHKLFDIGIAGRVQFEKDQAGKMLIWALEPGPYGFTSNANNPFAQKVFRVIDGKLADATPEFCVQIVADPGQNYSLAKKWLTPKRAREFQQLPELPHDEDDTASAALSIALQNVYCRRFDQARADLEVWPAPEKAKMKAGFAAAIKDDYPDFAASLLK